MAGQRALQVQQKREVQKGAGGDPAHKGLYVEC